MSKKPYKYTLHEKLRKMSVEDYESAMKFLPEHLNIHPGTLRNWLHLKEGDYREIPGTTLVKLANFFQCPVEEMLSVQPDSSREAFQSFKSIVI